MDTVKHVGKRKGKDVYRVYHGGENYRVEYNGEEFDNVSLWYSPKERHFKNKKDFIEAESVDAHTFFAIVGMVERFIKG